ncbi:hypothetical protein WPS_31700 [Vulcanimicrobium alpinum]|uniref:Uncharacterized protein n=1 Tax=Vulcanimicrobium alpinum TaxID=3016050 RepID=A0AAN1XYV2_UNVUL|nr:hypothetical protein [Vulcanimicrobium alpinum]BDE07894.1 hypothetical protein WPS_31700 [Vulcanimicrobium alpinum]
MTYAHPAFVAAARSTPVRLGSLSVPASARKNVEAAFAYLSQDAVERTLIDRLLHGPAQHRITINHHDDDSYDPNTHAIHWDPHSALLTTDGGRQSPALGLGHEIDHALENARIEDRLQAMLDPDYDTLEERRVIVGSERHAATTLHEAIRHDHAGTCYKVASPTARRAQFLRPA